MKKLLMSNIILLALGLLSFKSPLIHGDGSYTFDPDKSKIEWVGKKLTGEHVGTINLKGGNLVMSSHSIASGKFEMDMTSITNTDLSGESKEDLEGHLRSDDFFSSEKFPIASFEIMSTVPLEGDANGNNLSIKGNLTIKGITNEIQFPAQVTIADQNITVKATITFDRTKWNIKYKSKTIFSDLGDKFIYDDIELKISLVGNLSK